MTFLYVAYTRNWFLMKHIVKWYGNQFYLQCLNDALLKVLAR